MAAKSPPIPSTDRNSPEEAGPFETLEKSIEQIQAVYLALVTREPSAQLELCQEVGRTLRCAIRSYSQVLSDVALGEDAEEDDYDEEEDEDD
jgi:hypothetical protein